MITLMLNGLISIIKELGIPKRFIPLVVIALGIGLSLLINDVSKTSVIDGIVYGLSAMGLWTGTMSTFKVGIKPEDLEK